MVRSSPGVKPSTDFGEGTAVDCAAAVTDRKTVRKKIAERRRVMMASFVATDGEQDYRIYKINTSFALLVVAVCRGCVARDLRAADFVVFVACK
jgi:hypothetical protein